MCLSSQNNFFFDVFEFHPMHNSSVGSVVDSLSHLSLAYFRYFGSRMCNGNEGVVDILSHLSSEIVAIMFVIDPRVEASITKSSKNITSPSFGILALALLALASRHSHSHRENSWPSTQWGRSNKHWYHSCDPQ